MANGLNPIDWLEPDFSAARAIDVRVLDEDALGYRLRVCGTPAWIPRADTMDSADWRLATVQAVQDAALEVLGPLGQVWPQCPVHGVHPLDPTIDGPASAPWWTCPRSGQTVVEIGRLTV